LLINILGCEEHEFWHFSLLECWPYELPDGSTFDTNGTLADGGYYTYQCVNST